ncbi:C40 family peptidase [Ilumatobacter sp.]|uniref:C40 family peptidase n=1 Tax=Ilumatobacter sp. TaxID=1967498 RepID=UPI003AF8524E
MTRDHHHNSSIRRRARRVIASLAVIGGVAVTGAAVGDTAGAAPATTSTVIADAADRAVTALERWRQTQNPADYVWFVRHRDHVASMTESDIDLASGTLRNEWAQVAIPKQHALLNAVSQLGVPYRSLTSKPGVGFDCSGLTIWAFGEAGVSLPRISRDQINDAEGVDRDDAEAGDLVYYPGHVSIYLGADTMVHSPNSGNHVEVRALPDRSLRFGDATPAIGPVDAATGVAADSLMDRALAISE